MVRGEQFEIESLKYLKDKYENQDISFEVCGGMDSTVSDIAVIINGQISFYIEAKMNAAQSGQFVILPDKVKRNFYFSPRNKSVENIFTDIIIKYINDNYETFLQAGTAGEDIDIDNSVFANWIINHYQNKGVKYLITYNNEFIIFPIEKFASYFLISAKARNKGSGSRQPAKKNWPSITEFVTDNYDVVKVDSLREGSKNRLLAYTSQLVDQESFNLDQLTYQFSDRPPVDEYEIRLLNRKTKNTTVIFSIKVLSEQIETDLSDFENKFNKEAN